MILESQSRRTLRRCSSPPSSRRPRRGCSTSSWSLLRLFYPTRRYLVAAKLPLSHCPEHALQLPEPMDLAGEVVPRGPVSQVARNLHDGEALVEHVDRHARFGSEERRVGNAWRSERARYA